MSELNPVAMTLLEKMQSRNGVMTFRIEPNGAKIFILLQELKAAGLIEEVNSGTMLDYRYRLTDKGRAKL